MRLLPEITGLRGIASFHVLILHVLVLYSFAHPVSWNPASSLMSYGWIGVDLFFVLSGFLLSLPLLAKPASMRMPGFWGRYMVRRWWRIAPPYYVSIVVALALAGQLAYLVQKPMDIALHLTFLHSVRQDTLGSIVPVYWTLASEFQFYLLLPLFVLALRGRRWPIALAIASLITLVWRATTYHGPRELAWASFTLPGFLIHFSLGVLAARWHLAGFRSPVKMRHAVPAILVVFFVLPLAWLGSPAFTQGDGSWLGNLILRPLLAVGFAALVLLVTSQHSLLQRALALSPMRVLGEQSYSLYLVHVPVLVAINEWTAFRDHGLWLYALVGTVASLAAAAVFYHAIERPSLAVRQWLDERRRSPQPAPVAALPTRPLAAEPRPAPA